MRPSELLIHAGIYFVPAPFLWGVCFQDIDRNNICWPTKHWFPKEVEIVCKSSTKLYVHKFKFCSNSKRESYEGIFLILQQHKTFFVHKFWQNIELGNGRINPARICPFHLHTFVNVIVRCNFLPNGTFLSNRMISSGNFYPVKIFLMGCFVKWNTLLHFPCRVFF